MGRTSDRTQCAMYECVLCVLCAICAVCASTVSVDYCRQVKELKLETGLGSEIPERALTLEGSPRMLKLCAHDAAPEAARAIMRALLLYGLRYRAHEIEEADCSFEELQALIDTDDQKYFVLSMATAWRQEGPIPAQCAAGACGLAGSRLDVLGRGAAPAGRRLLARLAPWAPFYCLQDWDKLTQPECGFLYDTLSTSKPCSNWPVIECSDDCVTVAIEPGKYEAEQCQLAHELAKVAGPLRLIFTTERTNGSYLFFDHDIWIDSKERIWPAPSNPKLNSLEAVSLSLGDVLKLLHFAPPVLNLAYSFRPPPEMLRRVLINNTTKKLDIHTAACEAIIASENLARNWLTCNETFCHLKPAVRIYVCEDEEDKDKRYTTIISIVKSYWYTITNQTGLDLMEVKINCSITDEVKSDLKRVWAHFKLRVTLRGVVAMGSGGGSALAEYASGVTRVPLLLVATPASGAELAEARSTSPTVPALASAVRAFLASCGWQRVALLREEGFCDIWKRSLGLAEALSKQDLVTHQEIVHADNATDALDALRACDARVIVVDASADTARNVLVKAEERGMTPKAGYVWLVIGAAGNSDWLPTTPEFSYVTVSGGWRGGPAPSGLLGSSTLRDALDSVFPTWPPHASALVDALLLMLQGTTRLEKLYPEHMNDPHRPGVIRKFFELLDNITVHGAARDIRANSSPLVFAHRWTSDGARLVAAWDGRRHMHLDNDKLCGGLPDGAHCYTSHSGDHFTPHCHDIAWAILLCALAVGLPSLYAASIARRRRLKRRDRAVEERALLRGGHSAADAAAGAALGEYAVPRDALQLLDELGTGHYGVVHEAVLRRPACAALGVAVKAPRADAPAGAAAELLREAALLATLRHDHVVRFTGVCWEGGPLVLMEHAFYGDLRRYLRARRTLAERAHAGLPEPEAAHVAAAALTRLASEAAAALGYLAQHRLVHRDIRAANCLVDVHRSLKLADFGMARRLDKSGEGEYFCKRRAMFPVLWMAPESLSSGVFSPASDVWALGVLLLELATLGERPYGAWTTPRVLRHVRDGGAPPLPQDIAASTRYVTAMCWHRSAEERPSAAELVTYFAENQRAIQPALEPYADADTNADAVPEADEYIEEWSN